MDLAVYISELLGLQGEVNVPGIGRFAQVRVNGYYDDAKKTFHPPAHLINFETATNEDEGLAKYISDKKNISLASAKYFIDKYIIDVKNRAGSQKVSIADLGYLSVENAALTFTPSNTQGQNDPSFFGFPPVKAYKNDEQPAATHTPPVPPATEEVKAVTPPPAEEVPEATVLTDQEVATPTVITAEEEALQQPVYEEADEAEQKSVKNIWIVVLLVIAIALLSLIGLYQYYPAMFDRFTGKQDTLIGSEKKQVSPVVVPDTITKIAPDTGTKTPAQPQSTAQAPAAVSGVADTSNRGHYEILGGAFAKKSEVEKSIALYKKMGFDARELNNVPGKLHKITLGTYYTAAEAADAQKKILSTKKISQKTIYIQYYKPKK